jgi:Family of unknown function (DUF5519)
MVAQGGLALGALRSSRRGVRRWHPWPVSSSSLTRREGQRPRTTSTNPHTQLDQQPTDSSVREELARRVFALPGVIEQPSGISVPGARALMLAPGEPVGPPEAFLIDREFAHLHPAPDYSLHAMLPLELAQAAIDAGWAEPHPMARRGLIPSTAVMLYAPRDTSEVGVTETLVRASHAFARPS